MSRRLAFTLVVLFALPATAGASCPLDGAAELGRARYESMALVELSLREGSPRCAAKARAYADYLQVGPLEGACAARARVESEPALEDDADMLAFRAWMAWRCGQPRDAHRLALSALEASEEAAAAWTLLGRVLAARFEEAGAQAAFRRALEVDPGETQALLGLASVAGSRSERIELLRAFVENADARGEPRERKRSALENIEFVEALGDREIFRLEKAELPGTIELDPIVRGPGRISGWTIPLAFGEGRAFPALFDSGASGLHLAPRAAENGGLEALSEGTLVGGGGAGEHDVARGLLPTLDLGPLVFGDALGVRAAGELHQTGRYVAILGVDLFGGTRLAFDPRARRVEVIETLAAEEEPDPRAIDPWPRGRARREILRVSGMLLVPVRVRVRDEVSEILMLLDTGASRTLVAARAARAFSNRRLGGQRGGRGYGGAVPFVGEIPTADVRLGEVEHGLRGLPVFSLEARSRLVGIPVGGFLGVDWLSRQGFTIDLREGWVEVAERRSRRRR